jgi:hypothetical protein
MVVALVTLLRRRDAMWSPPSVVIFMDSDFKRPDVGGPEQGNRSFFLFFFKPKSWLYTRQ